MSPDESSSNKSSQDEKSNSPRQDTTLSARRARLRSLTRSALPPDPYSQSKDESASGNISIENEIENDNKNAAFEFDYQDSSKSNGTITEPSTAPTYSNQVLPDPYSSTNLSAPSHEHPRGGSILGSALGSALTPGLANNSNLSHNQSPLDTGSGAGFGLDFFNTPATGSENGDSESRDLAATEETPPENSSNPVNPSNIDTHQTLDAKHNSFTEQALMELGANTNASTNMNIQVPPKDFAAMQPQGVEFGAIETSEDSADADTSRAGKRRRRRRSKKNSESGDTGDENNLVDSPQTEDSEIAGEPEHDQASTIETEIAQSSQEQELVQSTSIPDSNPKIDSEITANSMLDMSARTDNQDSSHSPDQNYPDQNYLYQETSEVEQGNQLVSNNSFCLEETATALQEDDDRSRPSASAGFGVTELETVVVPLNSVKEQQGQILELVNSIDQALGVCALNLAHLGESGAEQVEALTSLKDTLQNQTFLELGLNLNTLMETLSAALEPMKAVGELVPAIDQLITTMEAKIEVETRTKLSPDQLITALADQLCAEQIDPWTFKSAYMAVFPDEHPATLLHRLVELLGTQRLSQDLFRAAYDAVQMAEPPPRLMRRKIEGDPDGATEVVKVVQDETILAQMEELRQSNLALKKMIEEREGELTRRIEERESEYHEMLASKEHEIHESQELLHSRFEEFNARYEEMVMTVNLRDEELRNKDEEVSRKENEIYQLKTQLEELRENFNDTVANLQTQLNTTKHAAEEASRNSGLNSSPQSESSFAPPKPEEIKPQQQGFFENDQKSPFLKQQMDTFNSMSQDSQRQSGAHAPVPGQAPGGNQGANASSQAASSQSPAFPQGQNPFMPAPAMQAPAMQSPAMQTPGGIPTGPIQEISNQAIPKPASNTPQINAGPGRHGNGVRAQVFEVIVRQALAGAPWREICAGPMKVNNIMPDEVESEVKRREALLKR